MTSRARYSSSSRSTAPADPPDGGRAAFAPDAHRHRPRPAESATCPKTAPYWHRGIKGALAETPIPGVSADPLAHHPGVTQEIADGRMTPPDRLRVEPID